MKEENKNTNIKEIESEELMKMYEQISNFVKYLEKEETKTTEE